MGAGREAPPRAEPETRRGTRAALRDAPRPTAGLGGGAPVRLPVGRGWTAGAVTDAGGVTALDPCPRSAFWRRAAAPMRHAGSGRPPWPRARSTGARSAPPPVRD